MDSDPIPHIRRFARSNLIGLILSVLTFPIVGYMTIDTDEVLLRIIGIIVLFGLFFGGGVFAILWRDRPQKYSIEFDYEQMNEISAFCTNNVKGKWRKYDPEEIGTKASICVFTFSDESDAAMAKVFFKK